MTYYFKRTILLLLGTLYLFGLYETISDDHKYTDKDVLIGAVIFPYAITVGAQSIYNIGFTSSEFRDYKKQCLRGSTVLKMERYLRHRFCECMFDERKVPICEAKSKIDY